MGNGPVVHLQPAGPDQPDAAAPQESDTQFSLPAISDPASTEVGVILMGLDVAQLLAGLGLAALAQDPTVVTLLIDQIRHGGEARLTLDDLVDLGVHRWRAERDAHQPAPAGSAALRQAWAQAYQGVAARQAGAPAVAAYLTACWLRSAEVYRHCAASSTDPSDLGQPSSSGWPEADGPAMSSSRTRSS